MNCIPLPDELVRKVYSFIHPAFEYVAYVKALELHAQWEAALEHICMHRVQALNPDIREIIEYNDIISSYASAGNDYLCIIRDFLKANPLFERPARAELHLDIGQYMWRWDTEYCKNQVERMERDIHRQRVCLLARGGVAEILLYHDMAYMLREGSLDTIEYNCRMNNIHVLPAPVWLNGNVYRNQLVRLLVAL